VLYIQVTIASKVLLHANTTATRMRLNSVCYLADLLLLQVSCLAHYFCRQCALLSCCIYLFTPLVLHGILI